VSTPATLRVVERELQVFRRLWRGSVFSSFVSPVLFLAAMGVGLGGLVDQRGSVQGLDYLAFVTPGLMAATALLQAAGESLWPVLGGMKWMRTSHAMVATTVGAADVFGGFLVWTAIRAVMSSTAFVIVAALLGGVASPWGVLAVPASVLGALSLAAPLAAFSATQETDLAFPIIMRIGIIPLFLFSGTFFPVSQLPRGLRPLSALSPLWHAVELARAATTGHVHWAAAAVHVVVLVACLAAGTALGIRTYTRRLTP
jgi:lipooligosaccharide transport system permease protein